MIKDLNPVVPDQSALILTLAWEKSSWLAQKSHQGSFAENLELGSASHAVPVGVWVGMWQAQAFGIQPLQLPRGIKQSHWKQREDADYNASSHSSSRREPQLLLVEVWGKLKLVTAQGYVEIPKQWACITTEHGN